MTTPRFVWHDLNTSDSAAAQGFYGELFNWKFEGSDYAHIKSGDRMIGGVRTIGADEKMPPNWLGYVGVDDVRATTEKMTAAGGKVIVPPMDMPNVGTFSVVADPSGGVLAPWKSARPAEDVESDDLPPMYTFCWNELASTNIDAATKFYASTLGWKPEAVDMGNNMTYTLFKRPGHKADAGGAMASQPGQPGSYWMSYVSVPKADDTVAKAKQLGANIIVPPMDIPNVGRFAIFTDPQGAAIAILQPA